jgi:hypothetical protein
MFWGLSIITDDRNGNLAQKFTISIDVFEMIIIHALKNTINRKARSQSWISPFLAIHLIIHA